MESEKYLEGQSMQRPPLFESDGFIYWKNRFETYVKSKDLDLWHVITDGDFPPIQFNPETKKDEIVSFHKQDDDLKKKLAKNNEAKMASLILGFPNISLATVSSRSGSLVGRGSTCNRVCGREYPSAVRVCPWSITSLKCVLTQEHLDAICAKYFVPEEVHPQLPSSDATMHERPAGKVGMYTRFFDYANYRIPFSTFFVSVLTHFRIPFSQLSVFGSAKMDLNAFIRTTDPRKVRIVERARAEYERPIVTVAKHRTVTLLPTTVSRPSGELSESIEREFGEDGSDGGGQEDASVAGHGNVRPVVPIFSSSVLLLEGVTALPTLPFITSSVTASPLEEGGDHTDSVIGPSLRSVAASARFVVLSDFSHHSTTNSAPLFR
ncbi:hypothetical protein Tco_0269230 [Tanacetum coccineum]